MSAVAKQGNTVFICKSKFFITLGNQGIFLALYYKLEFRTRRKDSRKLPALPSRIITVCIANTLT